MRKNPVGWFEIYVEDIERATKFYEGVFEVTLTQMQMPEQFSGMEMWSFPEDYSAYGAPGAIVKMPNVSPGTGGTLVYMSCEDCAYESSRVAEHGGKVLHEKFSIGDFGFVSMIEDTEGNTIGLHSQR